MSCTLAPVTPLPDNGIALMGEAVHYSENCGYDSPLPPRMRVRVDFVK